MNHDNVKYTSYTNEELCKLMHQESQQGTYVVCFQGNCYKDEYMFFCDMASAFRFPEYFGYNWDALDECICDLDWLKFNKVLVVIENYHFMFQNDVKNKEFVLQCMNNTAEYWNEQNIPFIVFLNSKAD